MAEAVKDILFDETGDLAWVDGDLVWDHSDDQHIQDILTAVPGFYTLYPLVGANIRTMINGSAPADLFGEIRSQLIADGYEVNKVDYIDGALNIDCERKTYEEQITVDSVYLTVQTYTPDTYLHDWVAPYSYCGVALQGTAENSPSWTITRIEVLLNGSTVVTKAYNVRWSERFTITYNL